MSLFGRTPFYQEAATAVEITPVEYVGAFGANSFVSELGPIPGQDVGDLAYYFGFRNSSSAPGTPSGATSIQNLTNGTSPHLSIARRTLASSSETSGAYTWQVARARAVALRGATHTTHSATIGGTTSSITVPSIAGPFDSGSMAVIFIGIGAATVTPSDLAALVAAAFPTWTARSSSQSPGGVGSGVWTLPITASGFTGGTFSINEVAGNTVAVLIASPT